MTDRARTEVSNDMEGLEEALGVPFFPEDDDGKCRRLRFLGYLPCPVRDQMRTRLHEFIRGRFTTERGGGTAFPWYVPGGCSDKDVYERLWKCEDESELPEIILSFDFGNFFRPEFRRKFLDTGVFEAVGPTMPSPVLRAAGIATHPLGYSVLAVLPYVILVDLTRLKGRPLPTMWADILDPMWKGELALGGDENHLASLAPLHLWREGGDDAVRALAANAKSLRHPTRMAKLAGSGNPEGAALSVSSWFFADGCSNKEKVQIHVPDDGAIASPLCVLAKRNRSPEASRFIEYLFGPEIAVVLRDSWLPSAVPAAVVSGQDRSALGSLGLKWLGWDFALGNDLSAIKERNEALFRASWKGTVG